MKHVLAITLLLVMLLLVTIGFAGTEQTWNGQISDTVCALQHPNPARGAKDQALRHQCTMLCISNGASYTFITDGKVYGISNQEQPDLEKYAGADVKVTGTMKGDTIIISKIEQTF